MFKRGMDPIHVFKFLIEESVRCCYVFFSIQLEMRGSYRFLILHLTHVNLIQNSY